jgi:hypothetical protein
VPLQLPPTSAGGRILPKEAEYGNKRKRVYTLSLLSQADENESASGNGTETFSSVLPVVQERNNNQ